MTIMDRGISPFSSTEACLVCFTKEGEGEGHV